MTARSADQSRIGNPANPSDRSPAGAMARLADGAAAARPWWLAAGLLTGVAGLAVAAWAHRRGLAAAAAVFSGLIPLPPPGHHPGLRGLLAGDPYVLCGLAVLTGAALALTAERAAARAGIDRNRGPSPRMRWLVT